ncbi:MAG: dUTP diphosphatase [Alphaproteobacteria bacterium]|nr:dUTP diphosphatase [Alphaproteobacteria bacterium]
MNICEIKILQKENCGDLPLPFYATEESAGMDLYAANETDITINPGERALIPTGFSMALQKGYEAQIRSRSGLALKSGIIVLNAPGTIDSDYRGEVGVILYNTSKEAFTVSRKMKIAQMVIAPIVQGKWIKVSSLEETDRGVGGFGSTGV